MGFIVIPGSKNPEHIKDNGDIFDFELTCDEMNKIAELNKGVRYYTRTEEHLKQLGAFVPTYEME